MTKKTLFWAMLILATCFMLAASCAADTWDAYTDFSSTTQGNRGWEYGMSANASLTGSYTFARFTASDGYPPSSVFAWHNNNGVGGAGENVPYPMICKNSGWTVGRIFANQMCMMPPSMIEWSILRWTAPAGTSGTYTVLARFQATEGATVVVNRIVSGTTTQLVSGATPGSVSCAAVVTPSAGDIYDFAVGKGNNWAYHNFFVTFMDGNWFQTGRVVDANNVGLSGVTVTDNNYSAVTNQNGDFSMVMFPGVHTLTLGKSGYTQRSVTTADLTTGGTNVGSFTLQHTGTWAMKADYIFASVSGAKLPLGNPNGQWKYGSYSGKAVSGYNFVPFTATSLCGDSSGSLQVWGNSIVAAPNPAPYPSIIFNPRGTWVDLLNWQEFGSKPGTSDSVVVRWVAPAPDYYNITSTSNITNIATGYSAVVKNAGSSYSTLASGAGVLTLNKYVVQMQAGEYIDFITQGTDSTDRIRLDATIKTGAIGITGYVQDSNLVKLAGAVVKNVNGTETATTDNAGVYTLIVSSTGSYDLAISKPGYETMTVTENITLTTLTPNKNYTLPVGVVVSGKVTDSASPNPAIAGVVVSSVDGVYSTTTDLAGNYSLLVSRGIVALGFSKTGYVGKTQALNMTAATTLSPVLSMGWDLASDFKYVAGGNPVSVLGSTWSYGSDVSTGEGFTPYPSNSGQMGGLSSLSPMWFSNITNGIKYSGFIKHMALPGNSTQWPMNVAPQSIDSGKVVASADGYRTIAKFTVGTAGVYKVSAKWSGTKVSGGTTAKVALRRTAGPTVTYVVGETTISGFAGSFAAGYTDSFGTPTVEYANNEMALNFGDTLESMVWDATDGWTQMDLTIAKSNTLVKGRVISDVPGNAPIPNARVQVEGYTLYTDKDGYYQTSVGAGYYEITTFKGGFGMGIGEVTAIADQTVTAADIVMHHLGTWDMSQDYTTLVNPNGQWSYGAFNQATSNTFGLLDYVITSIFNDGASNPQATATRWERVGFWRPMIGKNESDAPIIATGWGANPKYNYIEPHDMFISSGNINDIASVRWTTPATGAYDIYCRVFNQHAMGTSQGFAILKNGNILTKKLCAGFIGTNAAGYTDSTAGGAEQVFNLTIPLNSGDVVDFSHDFDYQSGYEWSTGHGTNVHPPLSLAITGSVVRNTTIIQCNSAADLKAQIAGNIVGTPIMMLTPLTVTAAANNYKDYSIYVSTNDRSQAFKLVGDANTIVVPVGWKITFSGKIISDPADPARKVIQLISINDQVLGTPLKPLGISGKALTAAGPSARDRFVRMWGKVTALVPNTTGTDDEKARWPYEYYIINDGSGDFKVKMRGQGTWMNDPLPIQAGTVGHYIAVMGIVVKDGADTVIFPRGYGSGLNDLDDYTGN